MSYNYNNIIQNPSGDFDKIRKKHLIKESCKEVMEEFAIRNSHGLSILQGKVDKLAVQVGLLGTIVSSSGGSPSCGSSDSYVPNNAFFVEDTIGIFRLFFLHCKGRIPVESLSGLLI